MEAEELRKASMIYKKGLSKYQQHINAAAEMLCKKNPAMIRRRGELLELARNEVHKSGYVYKKGKSRAKGFCSSEITRKRPKLDRDFRERRIKELEEDLASIRNRITIKEKRSEAGATVANFKLCDQLADEIASLKQQRREKESEHRELQRREKKSQWYLKKKLSSNTERDVLCSSSESDSSAALTKSQAVTSKSPLFSQPLSPNSIPDSESSTRSRSVTPRSPLFSQPLSPNVIPDSESSTRSRSVTPRSPLFSQPLSPNSIPDSESSARSQSVTPRSPLPFPSVSPSQESESSATVTRTRSITPTCPTEMGSSRTSISVTSDEESLCTVTDQHF